MFRFGEGISAIMVGILFARESAEFHLNNFNYAIIAAGCSITWFLKGAVYLNIDKKECQILDFKCKFTTLFNTKIGIYILYRNHF